MVKTVIVPSVRGGVVAAIVLGLGRALGEAIAVTQVIGNFIPLQRSIFEPGDTIASRVANQYQGAITNLQISSLIYLALILLVITFITNFGAQRIVKRFERKLVGASVTERCSLPEGDRTRATAVAGEPARRGRCDRGGDVAIAVLGDPRLGRWSVRGIPALNLDFFTKGPALFGEAGGGIAPAIVGVGAARQHRDDLSRCRSAS